MRAPTPGADRWTRALVASERPGDVRRPRVDVGPVSVVAEGATEGSEEEVPRPSPVRALDRAHEAPMVPGLRRSPVLGDAPGLAAHPPHQARDPRPEEAARVADRADAEQPDREFGELRGAAPHESVAGGEPAILWIALPSTAAS